MMMGPGPRSPSVDVFISLEKLIYNPGDLLSGTVELDLKRKLVCDLITIRLFGSARVFFMEIKTEQGQLSKTTGNEQEKVLIDVKADIWQTSDETDPTRELSIDEIVRLSSSTSIKPRRIIPSTLPGLESGRYKFPFSFQLPEGGLETSFDAEHSAGCVRYFLQMDANRNGITGLRKKLLFPIVRPSNLSNKKAALGHCEEEKTYKSKKGDVHIKITLPRVYFVPGEPVNGEITIKNSTDKSIKHSRLSLVQRAFCYATYPNVKIKETFFETAALAPTFEMIGILSVDYFLKLNVGFLRHCPEKSVIPTIKAPIVIGTHSPYNSKDYAGTSGNDDALPGYSEMPSVFDAPPPYSVCTSDAGLTKLPGTDNDGLAGYSPLYYQLGSDGDQVLRKRV
ncbi:hypothetical protein QR680_000056 [Steinernema hermaphroditum]|uniref:Arrestin C-terminal-like domain-containing protein n=1 Tax=Steinernema hermaphroditum TaxID=289476 RepID=A0AA39LCV7_9BILA|nr:hypothetical protein QR680_000056 [Steinernema hermaphroditum]